MKKITPFLWFDGNAEEAMNHLNRAVAGQRSGEGKKGQAGNAADE